MDSFDLISDPLFHINIAGRPIRGNPNARVTVVNFDDLECPFCAALYKELFPSTFQRYGGEVRFVYMNFPLAQHLWAIHAAVDADCLAAQNGDSYWNYVDYLHRNLDQIADDSRDVKKVSGLDEFPKLLLQPWTTVPRCRPVLRCTRQGSGPARSFAGLTSSA